MATLLSTIDDLKKYVSVNKNIEWASIEPYVKQADRKYLKPIIGELLYNDYATTVPAGNELKVYELLREASANLCWFIYLPLANVQVTDSGISVAGGENYKAAEWWQIRDLRRSFLDAGFQALDEALKIMEANEDEFSPWETTEGYTIFKELFVKRTETFNRWFNIANSRRTFLGLRPYMLEVHHQYFTAQLNAATIATIQSAVEDSHKQVLEYLQAAQIHYTVAKAVESGAFLLTETGMYQKQDDFPGYKMNPLTAQQLYTLKQDRITAAQEYYKKAITVIEANPTDFADYETKTTGTFVAPTNTKSTVSF